MFGVISKILVRRGKQETFDRVIKKSPLELGEVAYIIDENKLLVGNPDSEKGYDIVAEVIEGPHNNHLYARLEGHKNLIPICLVDRRKPY